MKKNIANYFILTVLILLLSSFNQRPMNKKVNIVDKGCIKGNFSIELVNQGVILEPDKFFTPSELNLACNSRFYKVNPKNQDLLKLYKLIQIISFPIRIVNHSDGKTYYGRLGFFPVNASSLNQAVTSYYRIAIPDQSFEQATAGRTVCRYEYWTYGRDRFLTWIIWLSDVPI